MGKAGGTEIAPNIWQIVSSSGDSVAFLGPKNSPEIASLKSYFNDEEYVLIDTHSFLQDTKISISSDIWINGTSVNIGCYYVQSLLEHPFLAVRYGEQELDEISEEFLHKYFNKFGMLSSLLLLEQERGKTIINPIFAYYSHHFKPYQIEKLRNHGLPVPKTVSTNNSFVSHNFVESNKCVQKPVSGHDYVHIVDEHNNDDMRELASPQLFQKYIDGNDIRVYLLDGSVVGAYEIQSRNRPEHLVDYRRYESGFREVELSDSEKNICGQTSDILNMNFCAVDCRRDTSSSNFYIVDCNPNPAFVPIEEDLGSRAITEALASYIGSKI